jgi:hypothetical protein
LNSYHATVVNDELRGIKKGVTSNGMLFIPRFKEIGQRLPTNRLGDRQIHAAYEKGFKE